MQGRWHYEKQTIWKGGHGRGYENGQRTTHMETVGFMHSTSPSSSLQLGDNTGGFLVPLAAKDLATFFFCSCEGPVPSVWKIVKPPMGNPRGFCMMGNKPSSSIGTLHFCSSLVQCPCGHHALAPVWAWVQVWVRVRVQVWVGVGVPL